MGEPLAADPVELEKQIVAQLVRDDDYIDVEAMIALKVEERLKHHKNENSSSTLVFEAEEVDDSTTSCGGFRRRTIWMLVILVMLVIGGVVVGVLYSLGGNDDWVRRPSSAPTTLVDHPLLEELRSLNALSDEDLSLFSDPTSSAQSTALTWLKNDTIVLSPGRSTQDLLQRYVLAVLYYTTSRPKWTWSYLSSNDVCTWNKGREHLQGVYCQADGVSIDELILDDNNLQGPLPWELVLLTNLEILSLSKNTITGSIPTRISELTRLRTFDASFNDLTGRLPTIFSSETTRILLHENGLVGTIPQGWWTSMPGLEVMWLYSNKLTGSLPTTIAQLSTLHDLNLGWNQVTGVLPSELGQMVSLNSVDLLKNQLTGMIPSELGNMLSLNYLSIGRNALTGTIPTELGQLRLLTRVEFNENKLTGTIPPELGQLISVETLWFNNNQLTGSVPSELGQLPVVESVSFKENELTGTIPSELGGIGSLHDFQFAGNSLTGSVNEFLCTGNHTWGWLSADCKEVDCECCTSCS
jgi:Leucine-rich repeat (LRR) protein